MKRDFNLPCSAKAIQRVFRQHGFIRQQRRKHRVKQDLRHIKQQWVLFEQVNVDTKHLYDIPEYYDAMKRFQLPCYQYTARDVVSGLMFVAYAQECSVTYATLFADYILAHFRACGVDLKGVTVQTDNGSEFVGAWKRRGPRGFTRMVEEVHGAQHTTIPPRAHTWQSDVETARNLIEREFFMIERFKSRADFLVKANTYQLFFNYARRNSSKEYRTSMEIIQERNPELNPKIGLLPVVFLEDLLPDTPPAYTCRRQAKGTRGIPCPILALTEETWCSTEDDKVEVFSEDRIPFPKHFSLAIERGIPCTFRLPYCVRFFLALFLFG